VGETWGILLRKFFLNIYFGLALSVLTLVGLFVLPLILLFNKIVLGRTIESAMRRAIRFYGWVLVCCIPFFGRTEVDYPGGIPAQPSVIVANHNSAIDPYLFGMIPIENSFVTSWPFNIPIYNFFMHLAGYANAANGWSEVCQKGKQLLANGSSVTIWPEGHRSRDGALGRFKNGAFSLAVEAKVPIVPVCVLGSAKVLPPGQRFLSPARVKLMVFSPEYPDSTLDGDEQKRELRHRVHRIIQNNLQQNGHFD
jgi:1-acyl-sn-glycerol-3-phosphate acyltransferase